LLPIAGIAATRLSAESLVEVLGWDFGPGGVDAVRVIVLNSDMPISY